MTDSWQLKLSRAQDHLKEICDRVDKVVGPNPQPGRVRVQRTKDKRTPFAYYLDLNVVEDPMLPVAVGDFLFNVRSALDHLAVANVSRRRKDKASFPIIKTDIWAVPANQRNAEALAVWEKATRGMRPKVLAVVQRAQPCIRAAKVGDSVDNHALTLLGAFQNADKHRELSIIAEGMTEPSGTAEREGVVDTLDFSALRSDQMLKNGARFFTSEHEVKVQIVGTVRIGIACTPRGPHREIPSALYQILMEAHSVTAEVESVM